MARNWLREGANSEEWGMNGYQENKRELRQAKASPAHRRRRHPI